MERKKWNSKSGETIGQLRLKRAVYYLTYGSAAAILLSIALSQVLLGLGLMALLVARQRWRFPPIRLPLFLFFVLTIVAVAFSPNPASGWPQIRKFYVFAILPMVFTTFNTWKQIRLLVFTWSGLAVLSAIYAGLQYIHRYHLAQEQYAYNYGFFLDGRVTGFASHWMTFGGQQMIVLLMLMSYLLFAAPQRWRLVAFVGIVILWSSIVLGLTRSIFLLGVPVGAIYLLWHWRRWIVGLVPMVLLLELLFGPVQVRERVVSAISPHQELDSNTHRVITRRTGWAMVRRHPWLGLGPEQIGPHFLEYVPPDIQKPLPKGYYGHLHSVYLQYAAERGVPALFALLWLIGRTLRDFYVGTRKYIAQPEVRFVLHGAIAAILALLAEGVFEYNLGDSEVLTMFLTLIACGYLALQIGSASRNGRTGALGAQQNQEQPEASAGLLHSAR